MVKNLVQLVVEKWKAFERASYVDLLNTPLFKFLLVTFALRVVKKIFYNVT